METGVLTYLLSCRFTQKQPWQILAISTCFGILLITVLVGHIFHATINRIFKVEDDFQKMQELKLQAEAADVAKSQVFTVSQFLNLHSFLFL